VAVKDKEGKVQRRGTVNNSREEFLEFLETYHSGRAVLEATRNWGLVYDWLEEILYDVALDHPLKVRAIAEARIKTDKISADILCDLLRPTFCLRPMSQTKRQGSPRTSYNSGCSLLESRPWARTEFTLFSTGTTRYSPRLPMSRIYLDVQGWNG